jgi:hypothetical protein
MPPRRPRDSRKAHGVSRNSSAPGSRAARSFRSRSARRPLLAHERRVARPVRHTPQERAEVRRSHTRCQPDVRRLRIVPQPRPVHGTSSNASPSFGASSRTRGRHRPLREARRIPWSSSPPSSIGSREPRTTPSRLPSLTRRHAPSRPRMPRGPTPHDLRAPLRCGRRRSPSPSGARSACRSRAPASMARAPCSCARTSRASRARTRATFHDCASPRR